MRKKKKAGIEKLDLRTEKVVVLKPQQSPLSSPPPGAGSLPLLSPSVPHLKPGSRDSPPPPSAPH